jgi:hypothetical protein
MRGADRGQKAGLIWLAEHRAGLFRVRCGYDQLLSDRIPRHRPVRCSSPLPHIFFRFGGNLMRPRAFACSVGLRKLAGTNLGCQKVGVGHGPDEPEFVMVFRRLVGVRPLWFREIRLSKPKPDPSVPPAVRQSVCCARLFPCLWPPERHTSRPDARVEDRSRHQPSRPYAPATGAGTPHAAQHLPHRAVPSVKGRKLRHGKGTLAVAPGRKAIDGQIEARQLVQRTGEDGGALSPG